MEKAEKLILTAGPSITEKEIAYVNDAVSNGWNEKWNEYIIKFQEEFSRYIGVISICDIVRWFYVFV